MMKNKSASLNNIKTIKSKPIKISMLLMGGRSPACLEWVRIFHKVSMLSEQTNILYEVHVADSMSYCLAGFSNRITAYHQLPAPAFNFQDWQDSLLNLVSKYQVQWIIPTCEEVFYLGKACLNNPTLRQKSWIAGFDTLQQLHDKHAFYQMIENINNQYEITDNQLIKVPKSIQFSINTQEAMLWKNLCLLYPILSTTAILTSLTNERDYAQLLGSSCDWVIKPCLSRFATRTLICPTLRQTLQAIFSESLSVCTDSFLLKLLNDIKDNCQSNHSKNVIKWIAQKYIQGKEVASYSLAQEGQLMAHTCYQANCRANANNASNSHQQTGASLDFQCVDVPLITSFVQNIIGNCHYTGQIGFDFIEDYQGKWWVLECNPRATSGIHLLSKKLVDKQKNTIITSIFQSETEAIRTPTKAYVQKPIDNSDNNKILHKSIKFAIAYEVLKNPRLLPLANHTLANSQDVIFDRQDMRPAIGQFVVSIQLVWKAWRHHKSVLAMTTHDIEWDG